MFFPPPRKVVEGDRAKRGGGGAAATLAEALTPHPGVRAERASKDAGPGARASPFEARPAGEHLRVRTKVNAA